MSGYAQKLKSDLLEQFKEKPNIEALVEVIGKQFDDLYIFFEQLKTERSIRTATGIQLDGIGEIVSLSRSEAKKMLFGEVPEGELDDETYRKYLVYKILKNTNNCTYADVMKAIKMFWGDTPIKYSENPDMPATIIFDFETQKGLADELVGIPFVKAGGVGLYVRMHHSPEQQIGVGFFAQKSQVCIYQCDEPDGKIQVLTDEDYCVLVDENNCVLID